MGIYIERMQAPPDNGCYLLTVVYDADGKMCAYPLERLNGFDAREAKRNAPAWHISQVPVHGRLVDADAAVSLLKSLGNREYRRESGTIQDAIKMLSSEEYTPTIITAEEVAADGR